MHFLRAQRLRLPLLVAAALACFAVAASVASANIVAAPATHQKFGIQLTPSAARSTAVPGSCTTDCGLMTYHGGPVMHGEKLYLVFWSPAGSGLYMPASYRSDVSTFVQDLATTDYASNTPMSVTQQYYDTTGPGGRHVFVPDAITLGGSYAVTDPLPNGGKDCTDSDAFGNSIPYCVTGQDIQNEISNFVSAHKLPTNTNTEYFLFTPNGLGSCDDSTSSACSYSQYCAWHTYNGNTSSPLVYADMPWAYQVEGCDINDAFGAGYANGNASDPVVGVFTHELAESMTDPEINGWFETNGAGEIGDKCAYLYKNGNTEGDLSGVANNGLGYWNVNLNRDEYLIQLEFDNYTADCQGHDTYSQPSVSVSPTSTTAGTAQTFTATVKSPNGAARAVNQVVWNFGDGSGRLTYGTSTSHTYAKAGTYSLTAIVTDYLGNERRTVQTVTVS